MRHALPAAILSLQAACMAAPAPRIASAAEPAFRPEVFFAGPTRGTGTFDTVIAAPAALTVESTGTAQPDGTFTLDQRIEIEGEAPRTRRWRIEPVGPGRYTGTLTDATGPVTLSAEGNRLSIRYTDRSGAAIEQILTLAPDGLSAHNLTKARLLGLTVATLDETIVRDP